MFSVSAAHSFSLLETTTLPATTAGGLYSDGRRINSGHLLRRPDIFPGGGNFKHGGIKHQEDLSHKYAYCSFAKNAQTWGVLQFGRSCNRLRLPNDQEKQIILGLIGLYQRRFMTKRDRSGACQAATPLWSNLLSVSVFVCPFLAYKGRENGGYGLIH